MLFLEETAERDLGNNYGQRTWKGNIDKRTEFMIALVEFPPNGASSLGGCPNAEYAGCLRGEARCSDSIPRAPLDWLNAKERLSCRDVQLADGSCK